MGLPTLLNTRSPLASTATQRAILEALPLARSFDAAAAVSGPVDGAPPDVGWAAFSFDWGSQVKIFVGPEA